MGLSDHGEPAPDLYRLLAVPIDASAEEIARAYRHKARSLHPDSRPQDAAAPARFRALVEAYQILIDPARRAEYDRARQHQPGRDSRPAAHIASQAANVPPVWPFSPAAPGVMAASALSPVAALWAGPVRVDPPARPPAADGRFDPPGRPAAADGRFDERLRAAELAALLRHYLDRRWDWPT